MSEKKLAKKKLAEKKIGRKKTGRNIGLPHLPHSAVCKIMKNFFLISKE
jgi:hypothetical protein